MYVKGNEKKFIQSLRKLAEDTGDRILAGVVMKLEQKYQVAPVRKER